MAWVSTSDIVQQYLSQISATANSSYAAATSALGAIASGVSASIGTIPIQWGPSVHDITSFPGYTKPTAPTITTDDWAFRNPNDPGDPLNGVDVVDAMALARQEFAGLVAPTFSGTLTLTPPVVPTAAPPARPVLSAVTPPSTVAPSAPPISTFPGGAPVPPVTTMPDLPSGGLPDTPTLTTPPAPTGSIPGAPTLNTTFTPPAYPGAPTLTTPNLPDLQEIILPTLVAPDLAGITALLASIRANKPVAPVIPATPDFRAEVTAYYALNNAQLTTFVSGCPALALVSSRLTELLSGTSTGMPTAVARGLRDRAFAAEDRQAIQAEQEALTDWLSRGFTLPGGALEAKLASVRQLNRDKKGQINRDLWLEEAKLEVENLRFAIQQGIAYEGMLRESWAKVADTSRAMAVSAIEAPLKVLEATVSVYRAQVEGWKAEFEAAREAVQVELAKVEVYKAQIDAQRLIGDINKNLVDMYVAQWTAAKTQVELYSAQIAAANGLLQAELGKIEYAGKQVQLYTAQVSAYEAGWKAYGEASRAELPKVELYKAQVDGYKAGWDGYGAQVQALTLPVETFKAQVGAYSATAQVHQGDQQTLIESYKAQIAAWEASWRSVYAEQIKARLTDIEVYKGDADVFKTIWEAYGEANKAEAIKVDAYKGQVEAFAAEVEAYGKSVDAAKTKADLSVTSIKLQLEAWAANVEKFKAMLQQEVERINVLVKGTGMEVDLYKAQGEIETGYTGFLGKKLDYSMNTDRLNFEQAAKGADLQMTANVETAKVALSALDGAARTGSQLAGSAMSALNVAASISSGSTSSDSYTEYHYYEET